jgi:iron complex transport system ATP-binding protein
VTLAIEDLAVAYGAEPVLDGVSVSVEAGSILAILGPNGVGKSTLLRAVAGTQEPDRGVIRLDGQPLHERSRRDRAAAVAYLPQAESPTFATTVFQSVLLGRTPHTSWRPSVEDRDRVGAVLDKLGLADLATRPVDELSQGQRQKVRIARLLVQEPRAMLLDEPTASLDVRHRLEVLELVREAARDRGATVVAMHDVELASRFADSVALLHGDGLYDVGAPEAVLTPAAIETVYGVSATVDRHGGRLHVTAERPLER